MQGDLASKLTALAGCSIATLKPSEQLLLECNRVFTNATHQRFERRTLLGLVINAMRPEHGQVTEFHQRIAEQLGRGSRWVQDTASVARASARPSSPPPSASPSPPKTSSFRL